MPVPFSGQANEEEKAVMTRARSKLAVVGTLCGALLLCASGGSARADDLEVAKQKKLWGSASTVGSSSRRATTT